MPQHRSTGTVKRRRRVTYRKTRKTTKKTRRKVQQRRRTRKGTSKVQSILFRKNCYTKKNAINWLKKHGYKYSKIDETDNFYRARQFPPRKYKKFKTLTPTPGIRLIIQI
jgi:hypothetical protein